MNNKSHYKNTVSMPMYCKGFSIIEILIGVVISSIIAMGVGSTYLSVRSIQNAHAGISEIRDTSFIVFDRIEYALKHANFINYQQQYQITALNPIDSIESPVVDISSDASATGASDRLTIQMNISDYANESTNCIGGASPQNTDTTKYSLQQEFFILNNNLYCKIKVDSFDIASTTKTSGVFSADNLIVQGVANMQVFYVLDNDNGCGVDITSASNNIWKTASQLGTNDWRNICAINIGLVTLSQTKQNVNDKDETKTFDLRPNTEIYDNYAKNIKFTPTDNLVNQLRFSSKIIRLRN
jgi:prepilin-type N-terminal cleavage/methylation domain-containing protein